MCEVSYVLCPMSYVMCDVSYVVCHVYYHCEDIIKRYYFLLFFIFEKNDFSFLFIFYSFTSQLDLGVDTDGTQIVKGTHTRKVFLFTNYLIWAKEQKNKSLKYNGYIQMSDMYLVEMAGTEEILQNSFEIHNATTSVCVVCFSAKTFRQKREWVQAIKRLCKESLVKRLTRWVVVCVCV